MRKHLLPLLFALLALGVRAESPKDYQVTGSLVALTDSVITVQKGDEKWEIARGPAKVDGKLAVGGKVTVFYTMTASAIEVKEAAAKKAEPAADKAADQPAKKKQS